MSGGTEETRAAACGPPPRHVFFEEGPHTVRSVFSGRELLLAYRLRYFVFVKELLWLRRRRRRIERDAYDASAVHIGVFEGGGLAAYLRLITRRPFMLEREFGALVAPGRIPAAHADGAVEISRLCVAPRARGAHGNFHPGRMSMLLLKGVYHWCGQNGAGRVCAAAGEDVVRLFREGGLPLEPLGGPVRMSGTPCRAVTMSWRAFEEENARARPSMLDWFRRGL